MNAIALQILMQSIPFLLIGGGLYLGFKQGSGILRDFSDRFNESSKAEYIRKHSSEQTFQLAVQINQYIRECNRSALIDLLQRLDKQTFLQIMVHYKHMYSKKFEANCSWVNKPAMPAGGNLVEHLQILLGNDFDITQLL